MQRIRRILCSLAVSIATAFSLFIGIQFVLWTIGGLYFSWIALEDVHGDHLLKPTPRMTPASVVAAPRCGVQMTFGAPKSTFSRIDMGNGTGR